MARMTADDMVTEARLSLGGETSETISDNMILRQINKSYIQVSAAFPFEELQASTTVTTAASTAEYSTVVLDILEIRDVIDSTNGLQTEKIDLWQYNQYTQGTTTQTGNTIYWFISGTNADGSKNITLYPTPNSVATITIQYRKKPTDLVISPTATSSVLPEPFDDSILQRAISRGWKILGDPKKAKAFMELAKENDSDAAKIAIKPSQVPVYYGSIVGSAWRG